MGNKCDLESERVISEEQGKTKIDKLGEGNVGHYETSAKDDINVTEVNRISSSGSKYRYQYKKHDQTFHKTPKNSLNVIQFVSILGISRDHSLDSS